jgi:BirA family biotin operon repressor/biotin-[acetyl-CoA-carboxylase] ligase
MDETSLRQTLSGLPISSVRYLQSTGSTNQVALEWAEDSAPDNALVVADEQTAGRGRLGRRWVTRPNTSLAMSLVFQPTAGEVKNLPLFSPLGALAVCEALSELYGLKAEVKWPNDVLVEKLKIAGILAEAAWQGSSVCAIILGIGVNVASGSVPSHQELLFPATSVEQEIEKRAAAQKGQSVKVNELNRLGLLRAILKNLLHLRGQVGSTSFLQLWENRLAFRGEQVRVEQAGQPARMGELLGVDLSGQLRLRSDMGEEHRIIAGDVHLRPNEMTPSTSLGG